MSAVVEYQRFDKRVAIFRRSVVARDGLRCLWAGRAKSIREFENEGLGQASVVLEVMVEQD